MAGERRRRRLLGTAAVVGALAAAPVLGTHATFTATTSTTGSTFSAAPDWRPPTASVPVVLRTGGSIPGYVRQGGTYRFHVSAAENPGSNPPSGLGTVTGDVSALTAGQTAAAMTASAATIAGTAYTHATAQQTAAATKAAATYATSATARDLATPTANAVTVAGSVVVDNTAPAPADVQTTNAGTAGSPGAGDTLVLTYSDVVDPVSVLAGWTGASTNVTVRINNTGGSTGDTFLVYNDANTALLPLGTVALGATGYVTANATFGAPGTAVRSTMTWGSTGTTSTVVVRLGTASAGAGTSTSTGTMVWTPTATVLDRAGNPGTTTAFSEPAPLDREF
ncbi:hypothetical protein [Quadrisphaera sp. DSM 44207]|uniref:hypothetical protein n=1 Tax=Quadrisphaera sp. DSM 44207 TaxID=1881057 RepID=UPI000887242E|nr:hypothetical protein [Quadrisphaera sp. DSM 44207]SDQ72162.1 hypothetical protein SAMN05428996_2540 [Quadrisphaera sp. DSM 44207]